MGKTFRKDSEYSYKFKNNRKNGDNKKNRNNRRKNELTTINDYDSQ